MKANEERRAKEKAEVDAILSMFPMEGDSKFKCCLGKDCLIGDPKKADSGDDRDDRLTRLKTDYATVLA